MSRQWGRGQTAAESRYFAFTCAISIASMGPRPDGRGKGGGAPKVERVLPASMGPRPDGRGKCEPSRAVSPAPRVNGAAARRPRKARPRPPALASILRQWGRGQTAAESWRHQGRPCQGLSASMGPRPDGRGKRLRLGGGRGRAIASMGPRPDGRGKLDARDGDPGGGRRQWGRGQTAAERGRPRSPRASTSQRQWGRGQTAAERDRSGAAYILGNMRQWGRGQTAAESRCAPCTPRAGLSRQWGRGQTAAESLAPQPGSTWCRGVNGAAARRPRKGWRVAISLLA